MLGCFVSRVALVVTFLKFQVCELVFDFMLFLFSFTLFFPCAFLSVGSVLLLAFLLYISSVHGCCQNFQPTLVIQYASTLTEIADFLAW